ncbi:hypothetical protein PRIPAC_90492, partial [Pristionchus pacificus]
KNIAREAMAVIGVQSGDTIAIKSSKTWKDQADEFFKHLDDSDLERLKILGSVEKRTALIAEQESCKGVSSGKIVESDLRHFQEASKKRIDKIAKKQKQQK